eukprot:224139-Chlamydomonas_euryale.AAC.1
MAPVLLASAWYRCQCEHTPPHLRRDGERLIGRRQCCRPWHAGRRRGRRQRRQQLVDMRLCRRQRLGVASKVDNRAIAARRQHR